MALFVPDAATRGSVTYLNPKEAFAKMPENTTKFGGDFPGI